MRRKKKVYLVETNHERKSGAAETVKVRESKRGINIIYFFSFKFSFNFESIFRKLEKKQNEE